MKLTIIIPCFNERATITKVLNNIFKIKAIKNKQIIVVDDCSQDRGIETIPKIIKNQISKIIIHKKNLGKGAAIKSAVPFIEGDVVIIQDADLEYNPKDFIKLLKFYSKNNPVIYGSRVLGKKRYSLKSFTSIYRIFFNHFLTILTNYVCNQQLTDAHTCYKMFNSKLFKKLNLQERGFGFCPEVTAKISKLNLRIYEVPINYKGRSYKEGKKIGMSDGFKAIFCILRYTFFK